MATEKSKNPKISPYNVSRSVLAVSKHARMRSATRKNPTAKLSPSQKPKKSIKRVSKLVLMPDYQNNYRPHLIRRYGLIVLAIFVILINAGYFMLQNSQILGDQKDITDARLLASTNNERERNGLSSLKLNSELTSAAESKAKDMMNRGYWSHDAPDGTTPWYWIESSGYKYTYAGENLARGFTNVDSIMRAWLESPTHRANVLDVNYTEVGFAVIPGKMNGKETTLVVAMYGQPKTAIAGIGKEQIAGTTTLAGQLEQDNLWTHLRRGMQSLTPSLIFVLIVLGIAAAIAAIAHFAHWKMSPQLKRTWKIHHALIKICFITILAIGSILSYGGGMI